MVLFRNIIAPLAIAAIAAEAFPLGLSLPSLDLEIRFPRGRGGSSRAGGSSKPAPASVPLPPKPPAKTSKTPANSASQSAVSSPSKASSSIASSPVSTSAPSVSASSSSGSSSNSALSSSSSASSGSSVTSSSSTSVSSGSSSASASGSSLSSSAASSTTALPRAPPIKAPVANVANQGSIPTSVKCPSSRGTNTYSQAQVNAAVQRAQQYVDAGTFALKGKKLKAPGFPKTFNNNEGVTMDPVCAGKTLKEFPIIPKGKLLTSQPTDANDKTRPGTDRVIFFSTGKVPTFCGLTTHANPNDNSVTGCF